MPAEVDLTLPLPGLSPVCGKPIVARFDGGRLSSDGGIDIAPTNLGGRFESGHF
jgi:hypothetical protein